LTWSFIAMARYHHNVNAKWRTVRFDATPQTFSLFR
jgi:hypothetical protein